MFSMLCGVEIMLFCVHSYVQYFLEFFSSHSKHEKNSV